jgi:uncharacterized protein (TIGR00290 family)
MTIPTLVSWSGGKDSCLALWRAQQSGEYVSHLLTALDETGLKARSHGVTKDLIISQGKSLGLINEFICASWQDYEGRFIEKLTVLHENGVRKAIFGDIDLISHREWEEKVCLAAQIIPTLPLWNEDRLSIVYEFLDAGFKARVVCVDGRFLNESHVGVEFDRQYIEKLPEGVDACGENGEFHTFVYDGPNFKQPVSWKSLGIETYKSPQEFGALTFHFDLLGSP